MLYRIDDVVAYAFQVCGAKVEAPLLGQAYIGILVAVSYVVGPTIRDGEIHEAARSRNEWWPAVGK